MQRARGRIVLTADQVATFLESPAGRRFRGLLAGGIILTAPMIFRIPVLRRYPLIRWLELVGGAALIVKAAEAIRDWERAGDRTRPIVIDVPPAA